MPEAKKNNTKKIKDYSIIKVVGKGGMGEVYLAKHPTLKREIILKRLKIRKKESIERFLNEAKIMLEFRHTNIVQIYDHFKEGTSRYIAMEYVKGKALNTVIEENESIPVPIALYMLYQISLGLFHAHSKQIIHRDIKPHNILISTTGVVKLTDFGIAKSTGELDTNLTRHGEVLGTPAYMSPEQFDNSAEITHCSDIYSLGVVFYEMITGVRPYKNEYSLEVINDISKGRYPAPDKYVKHLPPIAKKILKKTFNPKISKRYKNLYPLIKLLKRYFKKHNVLELKDSIKRILLNDPDLDKSPLFTSIKTHRTRNLIAATVIGAVVFFAGLSTLFVYTDRYYEWIRPAQYGKVMLEFPITNLSTDNIIVRIDNRYQRVKFTPGNDMIRQIYYLKEGEHTFSVISGSYKNSKQSVIYPRKIQKKLFSRSIDDQIFDGQIVNIPISKLWSQEVIVYFRFWDSINNDLLFTFDHYPEKKLKNLITEEDNLFIYHNKNFTNIKNYFKMKYRRDEIPFYSNKTYTFRVDEFKFKKNTYRQNIFKTKFNLDDRTVVVHTSLIPEPCKLIINSDLEKIPLIINNEKSGLVFTKDNYEYRKYNKLNFVIAEDQTSYRELLLPPGTYKIKISHKGPVKQKLLNSSDEFIINVKKENGKYIY